MLLYISYQPKGVAARQELPGPAPDTTSITGLAYVTFSGSNNVTSATDALVTTQIHSLPESGQFLETSEPEVISSDPEPPGCETDQITASANGRYLVTQYNCHANIFFQLSNLAETQAEPNLVSRSIFLNWSPDGNWLLSRNIDANEVTLLSADGSEEIGLALPFGTYGAAFSPDGEQVIYTASRGLGFGSEMGILNLIDGRRTLWQSDPHHIFAFPRLSPDGRHLAYILMPDSNIPFTLAELWLADESGQPLSLLDNQVDAGRGYPAMWSADGDYITYIRRENPEMPRADQVANALHSNIYQAEANTGSISQLTHFEQSMVYDIAWAPDGRQLAFTAQDAIWVMEPGQPPSQVSTMDNIARHPAWLVDRGRDLDE